MNSENKQKTEKTNPMKVLVEVDQRESVKRGVPAPYDKAYIELPVESLTSDERRYVADNLLVPGVSPETPRMRGKIMDCGRRYLLVVPKPSPCGLIEAIRCCIEDDTEKFRQKEERELEKEMEIQREVGVIETSAPDNPYQYVYVANRGLGWTDREAAVQAACGVSSRNIPVRCWSVSGSPRSDISDRITPFIKDKVAEAANDIENERVCFLEKEKDWKKVELERAEQARINRLCPYFTPGEWEMYDRGYLDLDDVEKRLEQNELNHIQSLLKPLGCAVHIHDVELEKKVPQHEYPFRFLRQVEGVTGRRGDLICDTVVQLKTVTVDGREIYIHVECG